MANMDIQVNQLLGLTVLAGLVGTFENVFIKPLLMVIWPQLGDEKFANQWNVAVNTTTLLVALLFSFGTLFALNQTGRLDIAQGILTGINSAFVAIGGYSAQSNLRKLMNSK